jgi:signal transduction histidine kinase
LSNAFKYSAGNPVLNLKEDSKNIFIEIIDNGIGIPQSEIENLFQSFYRASNARNIEGTGLGLVIVKEFVNINGGEIFVESEINKGSKFSIVFNKNS